MMVFPLDSSDGFYNCQITKISLFSKIFSTTQKDCALAFYLCTRFLKAIFERLLQNIKNTMTDAVVKSQRHRQSKVMECYKENTILQANSLLASS